MFKNGENFSKIKCKNKQKNNHFLIKKIKRCILRKKWEIILKICKK